jgi:hypothetical protein
VEQVQQCSRKQSAQGGRGWREADCTESAPIKRFYTNEATRLSNQKHLSTVLRPLHVRACQTICATKTNKEVLQLVGGRCTNASEMGATSRRRGLTKKSY